MSSGSSPLKAEAAAVGVELHRRHAEVGERCRRRRRCRGASSTRGEVAKIRVHELDAIAERGERARARAPARRDRDRVRGPVRRPRRAARGVCPPSPTRAVHEQRRRGRGWSSAQRLRRTSTGCVQDAMRQIPNSASARASSSRERLALQLREEAVVVPDVEVSSWPKHVDVARHAGGFAQPRMNQDAALRCRSRAACP